MTAIRTDYRGPTDTRGARIVAAWMDKNHRTQRMTVHLDHGLRHDDLHRKAALALMEEDEIDFDPDLHDLVCGETNTGYVWVRIYRGEK